MGRLKGHFKLLTVHAKVKLSEPHGALLNSVWLFQCLFVAHQSDDCDCTAGQAVHRAPLWAGGCTCTPQEPECARCTEVKKPQQKEPLKERLVLMHLDGYMQQSRVCALKQEAARLTTVVRASVERGAVGLGAGSTSFCHWVPLKRMACTLLPFTLDLDARLDTICSTCLAKAAGQRNKTDVSVWAKLTALLHAQAAGQGDEEYMRLLTGVL